jgi:hypothetical protein
MTHIVEHKIFRYSWELVRHTYIVDLESEIEIRQVEISPLSENRLLGQPYPLTSFFEIEIDQIQKNGKTVFSLRNICPVVIREKPVLNFLNPLKKAGSSLVTRRFQSQEGETETRWLYTDDFFLISLSSGDRHDLSMLLSLITSKLNMIALSIQSGRRIRSEYENQQQYRAAMSTMFSEGVDGAFRDVPVYQQHGEMAGSEIDVSAALMSADLRDLTEECASENPAGAESVPANIPDETDSAEKTLAERADPEPAPARLVREESDPWANIRIGSPSAERISEVQAPAVESATEGVLADSTPPEGIESVSCSRCGSGISGTAKFCRSCGAAVSTTLTAEQTPPQKSCSRCGFGISVTTKFCGSCGAAVSTAAPSECAPVSSRGTADAEDNTSTAGPGSAAGPVVNLKTIKELEDLSWLID